jgi:hypothetical protein
MQKVVLQEEEKTPVSTLGLLILYLYSDSVMMLILFLRDDTMLPIFQRNKVPPIFRVKMTDVKIQSSNTK